MAWLHAHIYGFMHVRMHGLMQVRGGGDPQEPQGVFILEGPWWREASQAQGAPLAPKTHSPSQGPRCPPLPCHGHPFLLPTPILHNFPGHRTTPCPWLQTQALPPTQGLRRPPRACHVILHLSPPLPGYAQLTEASTCPLLQNSLPPTKGASA